MRARPRKVVLLNFMMYYVYVCNAAKVVLFVGSELKVEFVQTVSLKKIAPGLSGGGFADSISFCARSTGRCSGYGASDYLFCVFYVVPEACHADVCGNYPSHRGGRPSPCLHGLHSGRE